MTCILRKKGSGIKPGTVQTAVANTPTNNPEPRPQNRHVARCSEVITTSELLDIQ